MRKLAIATASFIALAGAAATYAQQAAPQAPAPNAAGQTADAPAPHPMSGGHSHFMRGDRHGPGDRHAHGDRPFDRGTFALLPRPRDRNLTAADVQKIAEAFLLWHGNRAWKVVDVAPAADNAIGFSLATPEGAVVAKFRMNAQSGKVTRVS